MAKPQIGQRQLRVGRRSYSGCFYLITSATKDRVPVFENDEIAKAAIEGFSVPKLLKDSLLFSWVLMPDHAHWLLQLGSYDSISTLVGKMKSASARLAHRAGHCGQVWQAGFHERRIMDQEELPAFAQYIAQNPQRAGLVKHNEIYPYWSGASPFNHATYNTGAAASFADNIGSTPAGKGQSIATVGSSQRMAASNSGA